MSYRNFRDFTAVRSNPGDRHNYADKSIRDTRALQLNGSHPNFPINTRHRQPFCTTHLVQRFLFTITDLLAVHTRIFLIKYTVEYAATRFLLMICILYLPPSRPKKKTHEFVVLLMSRQMEALHSRLRRTSLGRLPFMYTHVRSISSENTVE
jgi:hypothetical protein